MRVLVATDGRKWFVRRVRTVIENVNTRTYECDMHIAGPLTLTEATRVAACVRRMRDDDGGPVNRLTKTAIDAIVADVLGRLHDARARRRR